VEHASDRTAVTRT